MAVQQLRRGFDIVTSGLATALRGGMGISATPAATKPAKPLELYEFEGCPYCRLTREALTELDLDAIIYPCPKGGKRFRPKVIRDGGKAQFPWLVDPNTGIQMYESVEIIEYLYRTYGGRPLPLKWRLGEIQKLVSSLTSVARPWQGMRADTARRPKQLLELYSFESSPFARLVRERLCEMEIPYILRSTGRTSLADWVPPPLRKALDIKPSNNLKNRSDLLEKTGKVGIPYLIDPNTDTAMYESGQIIEYLNATYGAAS